jgi:ureidoglycolate hydrolase
MALSLPLRTIAPERFAKFGDILDWQPEFGEEGFHVISRAEDPTGWRLAVFLVKRHQITRLERHPTSKESFEPVSGATVLCLAPPEDATAIEAFLLDKPVVLNKGVWHDIFALSAEALVKIAENLSVTGEFHELEAPLGVMVVGEKS